MATIKSLLNMSVEELEAMTPAQLTAYFSPYARLAPLEVKEEVEKDSNGQLDLNDVADSGKKRKPKQPKEDLGMLAQQLAKQYGVDISQMNLPTGLKK